MVMNGRPTRMDDFASESIRYDYPDAANAFSILNKQYGEYAKKLTDANNLIVVVGAEGLTLEGSRALMTGGSQLPD